MAYRLQCDGCDFEREHTDWADANREASEHEADHADHWVSIVDVPEA